ncbi:MAG: anthranilate synthase component I family protein [Sulfurospirillaceae bacterium]|jgi:anthranilate synthase component 1|nr:anthranilate synthase component I family protein [Sulfurospirillaceae bacterium]MCK9545341.1 anthranilate synthase component I family protein [Sulfurospirillaceae bacterium]NLM99860.1 anthranilate synthase component I family protein [Campylobacteraceae bacterium]
MMIVKSFLFDELTPISIFHKLSKLFKEEFGALFESAINSESGNFSYLFFGTRERVFLKDGKTFHLDEMGELNEISEDLFIYLKKRYKNIDNSYYKKIAKEHNIGFTDGFIGYVGYECVKIFEPTLKKSMDGLKDPVQIADLDLIRPKIVLAFSHKANKLTILSFCEEMKEKIEKISLALYEPHLHTPLIKSEIDPAKGSFAISKDEFMKKVEESKKLIQDGDIFQILISNRFTQYSKIDYLSFYRVLRSKNPSPYMFLLNYTTHAIAGSSPEVMVGLKEGNIILRPIAGTRRRGKDVDEDRAFEKELKEDEKEKSEHVMLIDLGRNDVNRVAKPGSVEVTDVMRIERYSHVMHMVSDIEGKLKEDSDMFDLFKSTFTAGTMTGAPKVRAMELIAKFEGLKRGFYSGAVGYFGFDGNMDSAIMIRTSYLDDEKILFQAGAGVVADSKPELEFLEVKNKLAALMSSLEDLKK